MIFNVVTIIAGLIVSRILFFEFPRLLELDSRSKALRISVIIPARNEENNLPLILEDLKHMSIDVDEIMCVDDCSTDDTAKKALLGKAKLISIKEKPIGWIGKSWACQIGADAAEGDIFLFLDADVRLAKNGIKKIVDTFQEHKATISVLPYHKTGSCYEKFSMFFNMVQFAANGLGLPKFLPLRNRKAGLYGPVILISREDYYMSGGHEAIKSSIIDDLAIGKRLKDLGMPFELFLGDETISYRMYGGGMKELIQGWTKNQAEGARKTPFPLFAMMFLWITSCTSVPILLKIAVFEGNFNGALIWLMLYMLWVFELRRTLPKIGNFSMLDVLIYPVYLFGFLCIFSLSIIKNALHVKVTWKDREIRSGK